MYQDAELCYRAASSRDARFDGVFYIGVTSTGIYCRTWADQLAKRFVADRPDVRDPVALAKWVHGLRGEWRAAVEYEKLGWSKQRKVDEVGAAATLVGLEVGPADANGNHPWRACAVGDASRREIFTVGAFVLVIVLIGVFPSVLGAVIVPGVSAIAARYVL